MVDHLKRVKKVPWVYHSLSVLLFLAADPFPEILQRASFYRWMRREDVLSIEGPPPEPFEFCMVSKWVDNWNIPRYVRS